VERLLLLWDEFDDWLLLVLQAIPGLRNLLK
jgi:hypothetical protein